MMTAPTITTQPANASVSVGQTATFSVMATGSAPLSYQWLQGSTAISGATAASYTTPATTAANSGEQFQVQVSNTAGSVTSNMATLTVTANPTAPADVVTHHYDVSRSGVNAAETALTTSNVNSTTFGKVGEFSVDGQIDSQALYLSQLAIPGQGAKNVLYVATEKDSVYAVDADSISGTNATVIWKSSVLGSGEAAVDGGSLPCGNINPNGVTATPVIDRGRNAIYVEAMSKSSTGTIIHRLHALDLTSGQRTLRRAGDDYRDVSGNRRQQPGRRGYVRSACAPRQGCAAGKWRQHLYRVVRTGRRLRRLFGLGDCV